MFNFTEYRTRMLWLTIGLVGSCLIAGVIDTFEDVLREHIMLASFIPLVVYISDATGTQMESIIIRAISKEKHFVLSDFFPKQFTITLAVGVTLSVIAGLGVLLLFDGIEIAVTISIGLFGGIVSSLFSGVLIPYYFWKFHQDPAEASGPIATVIQDFISVFVFFVVASIIL